MKTTEITVAKVNKVDITIIQNGEKRVAVRPICDALGIDFSAQLQSEARAITEAEYFESKRQMVMSFPLEEGKGANNE